MKEEEDEERFSLSRPPTISEHDFQSALNFLPSVGNGRRRQRMDHQERLEARHRRSTQLKKNREKRPVIQNIFFIIVESFLSKFLLFIVPTTFCMAPS